ncbi:transposase [Mesorhizobium sp. AR02]|nr:transposase [Mesorhizobium sp. AR02]
MEEDDQKLQVRLVGRNGRRRYDPASKDRLVSACLEPGVSVSRLALEHGVNANLLRKWIKKRTETQSLPPSSSPAFIPVQIESTSDRVLLRQSSMAAVDLPATCDEGKRSFPRTLTALATTDRFQTDASGQAAAALRKLKGRRSSIATFSGR